jgi:hypothetical protein
MNMIKFNIDGSTKWDWAISDEHLQWKLRGKGATIIRPLQGLKFWINALKGLLGFNHDTQIVERWQSDV